MTKPSVFQEINRQHAKISRLLMKSNNVFKSVKIDDNETISSKTKQRILYSQINDLLTSLFQSEYAMYESYNKPDANTHKSRIHYDFTIINRNLALLGVTNHKAILKKLFNIFRKLQIHLKNANRISFADKIKRRINPGYSVEAKVRIALSFLPKNYECAISNKYYDDINEDHPCFTIIRHNSGKNRGLNASIIVASMERYENQISLYISYDHYNPDANMTREDVIDPKVKIILELINEFVPNSYFKNYQEHDDKQPRWYD